MSNDDYSGVAWAVFDAKNVDVWNSRGVILSRSQFSSTQVNTRWPNWAIVAFLGWNTNTNYLEISRDNRVINHFNTEIDYSSISAWTTFNAWRIFTATWSYGFILQSNKILRWSFDASNNLLGIWAAAANLSIHLTLSAGNFDQKSKYLIQWNFMFVSWENRVYTINTESATWTEDQILLLDYGYNVTYMSNIWDQIIIYATDWKNGKQYFWDWISIWYERYIDWYDKPIIWWATLNNIDYVVVGTNFKRELYVVNGYQATRLYATDVYTNTFLSSKFFFAPDYANTIETIEQTIIIPWVWQIYKYGNNNVGLRPAITRDIVFPSDNTTNSNISTIFYQDGFSTDLFIYYLDWDNNNRIRQFLGKLDNTYPRFWTIKTLYDIWQVAYSTLKNAIKLRVGYELPIKWLPGLTSINVYTKTSWNYIDFYIRSYTTAPAIWDTYTNSWTTFTIYNTTLNIDREWTEIKDGIIIHCTYTWEISNINDFEIGTLTRTSGSWDSTIDFFQSDFGFKLIDKIWWDDRDDWKKIIMLDPVMDFKEYHKIQLKFDLMTSDPAITPTLHDFTLLYEQIEDDIKE